MKQIKYRPRKGFGLSKEKAEKYGNELHKIESYHGELTPELIVEVAKQEYNVLHGEFVWDDSEAAKLHRLNQARHLVQSIVEVVIIDKEESEQRSWFSVRDKVNNKEKYVTIQTAIENEEYSEQLLTKLVNQMENATTTMKLFQRFRRK